MPAPSKLRNLCDAKINAFDQDFSMMSLSTRSTTRFPKKINNRHVYRRSKVCYDPKQVPRNKSACSLFGTLQDKVISCVTSSKPSSNIKYIMKSSEERKAMTFLDFSLASTPRDKEIVTKTRVTEAKVTEAKVTEAKVTEAKVTEAKVTEAKVTEAKVDPPNENRGRPKVITLCSTKNTRQRNVATISASANQPEKEISSLSSQSGVSKKKFAPAVVPIKPVQKMDIRATLPDPNHQRNLSASPRLEPLQTISVTQVDFKEYNSKQPQLKSVKNIESSAFSWLKTGKKVIQAKTNTLIEESRTSREKSNTSIAESNISEQILPQKQRERGILNANETMSDKEKINTETKSNISTQCNQSQTYQCYNGGWGYGYGFRIPPVQTIPGVQTTANYNMPNFSWGGGYSMLPVQMVSDIQTTANFNMSHPNPSQTYQNYYSGFEFNCMPPLLYPYQMAPYAQTSTQFSISTPNNYQAHQSYADTFNQRLSIPQVQKETKKQSDTSDTNLSQACQSLSIPEADGQTKEKSNTNISEIFRRLSICCCCGIPCGCGSSCGCGGCQSYVNPYCNCSSPCGCGPCRPGCAPFPSCYRPCAPGCGGCGCGPACCGCGPFCGACGPGAPCCTPCCPCGPCGPCACCPPAFPCPSETDWNPFNCPPPPLNPNCIEGYEPTAFGIHLPKINMNVRVK